MIKKLLMLTVVLGMALATFSQSVCDIEVIQLGERDYEIRYNKDAGIITNMGKSVGWCRTWVWQGSTVTNKCPQNPCQYITCGEYVEVIGGRL